MPEVLFIQKINVIVFVFGSGYGLVLFFFFLVGWVWWVWLGNGELLISNKNNNKFIFKGNDLESTSE